MEIFVLLLYFNDNPYYGGQFSSAGTCRQAIGPLIKAMGEQVFHGNVIKPDRAYCLKTDRPLELPRSIPKSPDAEWLHGKNM